MTKIVLDASAVLAMLNQEPGHEVVEKYLPQGIISTVNLSEVVAVLTEIGMSMDEAENITRELIKEIIDFDHPQALTAASLKKTTRSKGLSLGDRACLALGESHQSPGADRRQSLG